MNINICKVEQFFGVELKKYLQERVMLDFNWIGIQLRNLHLKIGDQPTYSMINKSIDVTNERVYKIDQWMLKDLKAQRVGSFRDF